jgi:hypothetical protein
VPLAPPELPDVPDAPEPELPDWVADGWLLPDPVPDERLRAFESPEPAGACPVVCPPDEPALVEPAPVVDRVVLVVDVPTVSRVRTPARMFTSLDGCRLITVDLRDSPVTTTPGRRLWMTVVRLEGSDAT